ncbi:MAG: SHOCT domain-containing protein [Thermoplasmatota archaeon]
MIPTLDTVADYMHDDHMMRNWWFTINWYWMLILWIPLLIIGVLVYHDAEKRGMNGLLWFVLVVLPMVGLFFLFLYLVVRETDHDRYKNKSAVKILQERYARGEISKEEYLEMKKIIQK